MSEKYVCWQEDCWQYGRFEILDQFKEYIKYCKSQSEVEYTNSAFTFEFEQDAKDFVQNKNNESYRRQYVGFIWI